MISCPVYIVSTPPEVTAQNLALNSMQGLQTLVSTSNTQIVQPYQTLPLTFNAANPYNSLSIDATTIELAKHCHHQASTYLTSPLHCSPIITSSHQIVQPSQTLVTALADNNHQVSLEAIAEASRQHQPKIAPVPIAPKTPEIERFRKELEIVREFSTSGRKPKKVKRKTQIRRRNLTLREKIAILSEVKDNKNQLGELSLKYNITEDTIRKWKPLEERMQAALERSKNKSIRRLRGEYIHKLNKKLYVWFKRNSKKGMNFTGPIVRSE